MTKVSVFSSFFAAVAQNDKFLSQKNFSSEVRLLLKLLPLNYASSVIRLHIFVINSAAGLFKLLIYYAGLGFAFIL